MLDIRLNNTSAVIILYIFSFHATYLQRKNVFSAWTFRQIILSNNDVTRERKNTTVFIYTYVRATNNKLIV